MLLDSMVDYVLERGNQHYGQFAKKGHPNTNQALFNHRKLLEYLFQDNETSSFRLDDRKRISQLKYEEISTQLHYLSEKLHSELSKKHLAIDGDLYRLQNQWVKTKTPQFYSYYFLKFSYANTYSRMHQYFLSEIEKISSHKDTYSTVKKTIDAREICITNLRREIASLDIQDIEQSLKTLRNQAKQKKRKALENQQKGYLLKNKKNQEYDDDTGKSWKDKIEVVFQMISHLRKLTGFVVELIKNWKNIIYEMNEDPRRFRQRVIFFHNDANYLIKMIFDNRFVAESVLGQYLTFGNHYDPFLLKPTMILQKKRTEITEDQEIFLSLMKPSELQMDKMAKALVILAEEEYDEDEQSRFLDEKKNYGELQHRKRLIQRKRGLLISKSTSSLPKQQQMMERETLQRNIKFTNDKKSDNTQREIETVKMEKNQLNTKLRIQTSLNRVKNIRSMDLKKVSPYVNSNPNMSSNDKVAKAQRVIDIEQKFRMAQKQYTETTLTKKQGSLIARQGEKDLWDNSQKQIINNRIFNRYIEQNLKMMENANKKYLSHKKTSKMDRQNSLSSRQKKQLQYVSNLQYGFKQKQMKNTSLEKNSSLLQKKMKNYGTKGTKAIIQISDKGVRKNQNIIDYELIGKKGKNVSQILDSAKKAEQLEMLQSKLNPLTKQDLKQRQRLRREQDMGEYEELTKSKITNLYETQQFSQVVIVRQQPQKIQEVKKFLYDKIKEELVEEMKREKIRKAQELQDMIEAEKRRQYEQQMERIRQQQLRRKEEEERRRLAQLQKQRRKLAIQIRSEPVQFTPQTIYEYYDKIFGLQQSTYSKIFLDQPSCEKQKFLQEEVHYILLKGFYKEEEVSYCIIRFDWRYEKCRKMVFQYISTKDQQYFMASFHSFCEYLWKNDPVQQIQVTVRKDFRGSDAGREAMQDLQDYANRRGRTEKVSFSAKVESQIKQNEGLQGQNQQKNKTGQIQQQKQQQLQKQEQKQQALIDKQAYRHTWARPQNHRNINFPFTHYYFGKKFSIKCELLITDFQLKQKTVPKINQKAEIFTCYMYLLEELFRKCLTPEDMVEFREHSTNYRRLKDILRMVLEVQNKNPSIPQLQIFEGHNLQDLYKILQESDLYSQSDKYFWNILSEKLQKNRSIMFVLEFKILLDFSINSCYLEGRRFMRMNKRGEVRILKSIMYPKDQVYIFQTDVPDIKLFFMDGEHYKLMNVQLFVFLNIFFNNMTGEGKQYVQSFWMPQFAISGQNCKQIRRLTDFNLKMKKGAYLSEDVFFGNNQYIPNAVHFHPQEKDVIFMESVIVGFLHNNVQNNLTGLPIYSKLIDKHQMF